MSTDTEERTTEAATEIGDIDAEKSKASTETETADEPDDVECADVPAARKQRQKSDDRERRISVSIRGLVVSTIIMALIATVGAMTWLYIDARAQLDRQARLAGDIKRAEEIALNYAVNAAVMDCKDLGPWKQNLVKNTTPELGEKLTKAGTAMEQILLPLQWSSTAKPLASKVRSHENGVFVVDAFVSVMTKTVQAADSLQSTATYSITIDSNNAWKISDVGGIAAVVADK